MACVEGRLGELYISLDGITYTKFSQVVEASLEVTIDEIECTSKDSNGQRMFHPSFNSQQITGNLRLDDLDGSQNSVMSAVFAKTVFFVRFKLHTVMNGWQFDGSECFATTMTIGDPLDDTAMIDFTLRVNNLVMTYQP